MKHLRYFVWIIVPVALYLAYLGAGLPHFIWSYQWQNNGTYDPFVKRIYTRCVFVGPYGAFTIHPNDGRCGWIIFAKRSGRPHERISP